VHETTSVQFSLDILPHPDNLSTPRTCPWLLEQNLKTSINPNSWLWPIYHYQFGTRLHCRSADGGGGRGMSRGCPDPIASTPRWLHRQSHRTGLTRFTHLFSVYFSLILCFSSVWQTKLATRQGNCEGGPQIVSASAVLKSYHNCGTHYSKDQFEQSSPLSSRQLHGWHVVYQRRGRNAQPCNVHISGVFRGRWSYRKFLDNFALFL